jgi:D-inositol-3-phosphate glycosyltransferase
VSGYLVNGHEPADHADRILRLLANPAEAARLSSSAIQHAAGFSWEATAAEIREVYRDLAAARRDDLPAA